MIEVCHLCTCRHFKWGAKSRTSVIYVMSTTWLPLAPPPYIKQQQLRRRVLCDPLTGWRLRLHYGKSMFLSPPHATEKLDALSEVGVETRALLCKLRLHCRALFIKELIICLQKPVSGELHTFYSRRLLRLGIEPGALESGTQSPALHDWHPNQLI